MYKQINHDYAKTKWRHSKPNNNMGMLIMIMIILMFNVGVIYMTSASVEAKVITQCDITGATYDNLMSTDRAAFMVLIEHGEEFDEGDME